jgi:hypothetical protein
METQAEPQVAQGSALRFLCYLLFHSELLRHGNEDRFLWAREIYSSSRAGVFRLVHCFKLLRHILAMDLEGTEVCDWLNSIGVTGVLLKYRVSKREGLEKHAAPLQDAQRALGLVREHAKEFAG